MPPLPYTKVESANSLIPVFVLYDFKVGNTDYPFILINQRSRYYWLN